MTFMLAALLALAVPGFHVGRAFLTWFSRSGHEPARPPPYIIPAMGAWLIAMGFMVALLKTTWHMGHDTNYAPYLIAAGGVVVSIASAVIALRGVKAPHGSWILCSLAGMHLAFSGVDHLIFIWDEKNVGVISSDFAVETGVKCEASHMLIKKDGTAAKYRCPTIIRLGTMVGEPFIPWPAYQEGTSEKLGALVTELETSMNKEIAERQGSSK